LQQQSCLLLLLLLLAQHDQHHRPNARHRRHQPPPPPLLLLILLCCWMPWQQLVMHFASEVKLELLVLPCCRCCRHRCHLLACQLQQTLQVLLLLAAAAAAAAAGVCQPQVSNVLLLLGHCCE
jgi:hypothetical protein